jgi:hypothetical protein
LCAPRESERRSPRPSASERAGEAGARSMSASKRGSTAAAAAGGAGATRASRVTRPSAGEQLRERAPPAGRQKPAPRAAYSRERPTLLVIHVVVHLRVVVDAAHGERIERQDERQRQRCSGEATASTRRYVHANTPTCAPASHKGVDGGRCRAGRRCEDTRKEQSSDWGTAQARRSPLRHAQQSRRERRQRRTIILSLSPLSRAACWQRECMAPEEMKAMWRRNKGSISSCCSLHSLSPLHAHTRIDSSPALLHTSLRDALSSAPSRSPGLLPCRSTGEAWVACHHRR